MLNITLTIYDYFSQSYCVHVVFATDRTVTVRFDYTTLFKVFTFRIVKTLQKRT